MTPLNDYSLFFPTSRKWNQGNYSLLHLCGIRKYRKESNRLSVRLRAFHHDGWIDFLHIGYHDQVPWATYVCKIEFGYVPSLSD